MRLDNEKRLTRGENVKEKSENSEDSKKNKEWENWDASSYIKKWTVRNGGEKGSKVQSKYFKYRIYCILIRKREIRERRKRIHSFIQEVFIEHKVVSFGN